MTDIDPQDEISDKFRPGDRIKFLGKQWGMGIRGQTGVIEEVSLEPDADADIPSEFDFLPGWYVTLDIPRPITMAYRSKSGYDAFLPFRYKDDAELLVAARNEAFETYERLREEDP